MARASSSAVNDMGTHSDNDIMVYRSQLHPCSYLPGRLSQSLFLTIPPHFEDQYENLLAQRWRRSGTILYQPDCPDCQACRPIRLPVSKFVPSASQKRTLRKNQDLRVSMSRQTDLPAALELYCRYQTEWHGAVTAPKIEEAQDFLGVPPLDSALMLYHLDGQLIGAGWIDLLGDGISSVYFAFDPAFAKRRLGVFSMLCEIELARQLGKSWIYMGFWIKDCPTMDYKATWLPHELAVDCSWQRP